MIEQNAPSLVVGERCMPANSVLRIRSHAAPEPHKPSPETADAVARNPGTPLRTDWVEGARVNLSAVERRAATMTTRRTVKKEWQAAWLVKAITCIDLTTLAGDDTPARVQRLCAKAQEPAPKRPRRGAGARPHAEGRRRLRLSDHGGDGRQGA